MKLSLSVENRERLLSLLMSEYVIPDEYIESVKLAINTYSTKKYSDDTINKMVKKPQSLTNNLALLRERNGKTDLSLFRGMVCEWLVCAEYNALKNKGDVVLTILNPDSSSKADLLHIIRVSDGYKVVPGSDVKSGGSTYVFNQWKKIVNYRYDIPMVDIDGVLTTEEGMKQLTIKQRNELHEFQKKFPRKKPVKTLWSKSDISIVIADYLKYIEFEIRPSTDSELTVKDVDVKSIKEKIYSGSNSNKQTYSWIIYSDECKKLYNSTSEVLSTNSQPYKNSEVNKNIAPEVSKMSWSQTVYNKFLDFSVKHRKLVDIITTVTIAGAAATATFYANSYSARGNNNSDDNGSSISEYDSMDIDHHNYPDSRKSPRVHEVHPKNGKPYLRGGEDEEAKQRYREENDIDF